MGSLYRIFFIYRFDKKREKVGAYGRVCRQSCFVASHEPSFYTMRMQYLPDFLHYMLLRSRTIARVVSWLVSTAVEDSRTSA